MPGHLSALHGPQSCPHVAAGAAWLEGCRVGGERPLSVLAPVPFTEPHLSTLPVLLTRSSPTTQPDLFTEPSPWVISTGTDIALIAGETQGPPPGGQEGAPGESRPRPWVAPGRHSLRGEPGPARD